MKTLLEILREITADNRAAYISKAKEMAEESIEHAEELYDKAQAEVKRLEELIWDASVAALKKEFGEDYEAYYTSCDGTRHPYNALNHEIYKRKHNGKGYQQAVSARGAAHILVAYKQQGIGAKYVDRKVKDAADYYDSCVNNMPKRLERFGLDVESLKYTIVGTDGWGIEMYLNDGKQRNIHCRLVACALESEYMCPHYRFIVTEKKSK